MAQQGEKKQNPDVMEEDKKEKGKKTQPEVVDASPKPEEQNDPSEEFGTIIIGMKVDPKQKVKQGTEITYNDDEDNDDDNEDVSDESSSSAESIYSEDEYLRQKHEGHLDMLPESLLRRIAKKSRKNRKQERRDTQERIAREKRDEEAEEQGKVDKVSYEELLEPYYQSEREKTEKEEWAKMKEEKKKAKTADQ